MKANNAGLMGVEVRAVNVNQDKHVMRMGSAKRVMPARLIAPANSVALMDVAANAVFVMLVVNVRKVLVLTLILVSLIAAVKHVARMAVAAVAVPVNQMKFVRLEPVRNPIAHRTA